MGQLFGRRGGVAAVAVVLAAGILAPAAGPPVPLVDPVVADAGAAPDPRPDGPPSSAVLAGPVQRAGLAGTGAPEPSPAAPLSSDEVTAAESSEPAGSRGIPGSVLAAYQRAAEVLEQSDPGCHLDWSLLAAVGRVESGHAAAGRVDGAGVTRGRILGPLLDGSLPGTAVIADSDGGLLDGDPRFDRAVGPMQFLPGTWQDHGADGDGDGLRDPHDVLDAALAAGGYLCEGGGDLREPQAVAAALFRYNRSAAYGADVLAWARAYRSGATPAPGRSDPVPPVPVTPDPPAPDPLASDPLAPDPAVGDPAVLAAPGAPPDPGPAPESAPPAPPPSAAGGPDAAPLASSVPAGPAATAPTSAARPGDGAGASSPSLPTPPPPPSAPPVSTTSASPTPTDPAAPTSATDPAPPSEPAQPSGSSEPGPTASAARPAPTSSPMPTPPACTAEPVVVEQAAATPLPDDAGLVLRFPLPEPPAGCRVVEATLRLDPGDGAAGRTVTVRRITAPWTAGTAPVPGSEAPGVEAQPGPGDRTWTVTDLVADPRGGAGHGLLVTPAAPPAAPAELSVVFG